MSSQSSNLLRVSFLALALAAPAAAQDDPPASEAQARLDGPIFASNAGLRTLYDGGTFTEGVAVAPDGDVWFVDNRITQGPGDPMGRTLRHDPASGETAVEISPNGQVNGQKFDAAGDLLMASRAGYGSRALVRLDLDTREATLIAGSYAGDRLNGLNDLAVGPDGTIFFTDPRYLGIEPIEQPVYGVYAVPPEGGDAVLVTGDALKPNGVAVSPDGRTLYVAEHFIGNQDFAAMPEGAAPAYGPMRVLAWDLDGVTVAGAPRVVADFGTRDGPDGMITDAAGHLYVAARAEPAFGIRVYDQQGDEVAFLPTKEKPTNVAFGTGDAVGTLYVTAGGSLLAVDTRQQGWTSAR